MALIDIQIPRDYEPSVATTLQEILGKVLDKHTINVSIDPLVTEFIVLVYANMGLTDSFLHSISRAVEQSLQSSDFTLQVSSERVLRPIMYRAGSWRM